MDFLKIAKPLYKLLEKDAKFIWDAGCQKSFEELKAYLTIAPIVRASNLKLPFELYGHWRNSRTKGRRKALCGLLWKKNTE